MKKLSMIFLAILLSIAANAMAFGADTASKYTQAANFTKGRLNIISFCEQWGEQDLKELYDELTANTIGPEFSYLKYIYIYPDSPYGISGGYFEDIKFANNRITLGANCYIELYNGAAKLSIEEMAPILSHEYGHHFTIFNMIVHEKSLYTNWADSEYAKLRNLADYPVIYDANSPITYYRHWDIVEIAANDYVQLLGSDKAKASYRYLDAKQFVELKEDGVRYLQWHFNSKPQENTEIPLAAQVEGLYEYFLKISANQNLANVKKPAIKKLPEITALTEEKAFINKTYNLAFNGASGSGPFEYTIILYPKEPNSIPAVIKTLSDGQPLDATFGTLLGEKTNGEYLSVLEYYGGSCTLIVYAKDINGFIYASEPFVYDFGNDYFDLKNYLFDTP